MRSLLAWRPTIPIRKHLLLRHLPFCSLSLRQAAAVHERSVRPRLELLEEDELFVSSQLQSFREQVQEHVNDHRVEVIGAYTVLLRVLHVKLLKPYTKMTVIYIVFLMSKVSSHI